MSCETLTALAIVVIVLIGAVVLLVWRFSGGDGTVETPAEMWERYTNALEAARARPYEELDDLAKAAKAAGYCVRIFLDYGRTGNSLIELDSSEFSGIGRDVTIRGDSLLRAALDCQAILAHGYRPEMEGRWFVTRQGTRLQNLAASVDSDGNAYVYGRPSEEGIQGHCVPMAEIARWEEVGDGRSDQGKEVEE